MSHETILVTGGTGFLGPWIVEELLRRGKKVRLLCRNPERSPVPAQPGRVELVEGDILDVASLEDAMQGVDAVIHAAAMISFWKKNRPLMKEINATGTANVVDMCLEMGVKKLVYISSVAALGRPEGGGHVTAAQKWKDSPVNSYYGKTKYMGELEVHRGVQEGLPAVILNPGIVMGPGGPHSWTTGSNRMFSMIWNGFNHYSLGGSGYVGAGDVARAAAGMVDAPGGEGERYVLVSRSLRVREVLNMIADVLGKKHPQKAAGPRMASLMARLQLLRARFTGVEPQITPEIARYSAYVYTYDGSPIEQAIDFRYDDFETVIRETGAAFLKAYAGTGKR